MKRQLITRGHRLFLAGVLGTVLSACGATAQSTRVMGDGTEASGPETVADGKFIQRKVASGEELVLVSESSQPVTLDVSLFTNREKDVMPRVALYRADRPDEILAEGPMNVVGRLGGIQHGGYLQARLEKGEYRLRFAYDPALTGMAWVRMTIPRFGAEGHVVGSEALEATFRQDDKPMAFSFHDIEAGANRLCAKVDVFQPSRGVYLGVGFGTHKPAAKVVWTMPSPDRKTTLTHGLPFRSFDLGATDCLDMDFDEAGPVDVSLRVEGFPVGAMLNLSLNSYRNYRGGEPAIPALDSVVAPIRARMRDIVRTWGRKGQSPLEVRIPTLADKAVVASVTLGVRRIANRSEAEAPARQAYTLYDASGRVVGKGHVGGTMVSLTLAPNQGELRMAIDDQGLIPSDVVTLDAHMYDPSAP